MPIRVPTSRGARPRRGYGRRGPTSIRAAAARQAAPRFAAIGRVPAPSIAFRLEPGGSHFGFAFLVLGALLLPRPVLAQEPPASIPSSTAGERALREISEDLESLETFQAEFEQRQEWVGMDPSPPYRGVLYLRRPNLFRIEYREPAGHLQVSDGTRVWTWIPENGEVLVASLEKAVGGGGDLLRWVLRHSAADPEVAVEELEEGPVRCLTLRPEEGLGLARVRLWTAPGSPEVRRYEVTDAAGNVTVYRLRNVARNPRLRDDLFRFSPPEGVPVVELGSP